jgi:hypothetical protein
MSPFRNDKFSTQTWILISNLILPPCLWSGRVHILEDRSLKIDNITMDDIGEYSCEADNAVGMIVAAGMLIVHCEYN